MNQEEVGITEAAVSSGRILVADMRSSGSFRHMHCSMASVDGRMDHE